ncbi:hypothetical protein DOY81_010141 [Sarcophaga bullata]|nr:hypothetical protein DOY81_010141 [Sarcophaga bullata]
MYQVINYVVYPLNWDELIQLRELLLNNNFLRVLPYEIGKLFHLHVLGLGGNPLQKEFLQIYNEPNGTQKLLTYMLDNLSTVQNLQERGVMSHKIPHLGIFV